GHLHATTAFERERPRHYGNGENTHFLGHRRDDRRRTGTGTTAHAGGAEHHVGALQHFGDALAIFHGRVTADVRIGPGAQALGDGRAELQHGARFDLLQRLCIGVGTDEFHAFDVVAHHVIDRVAAATTDADDLDDC